MAYKLTDVNVSCKDFHARTESGDSEGTEGRVVVMKGEGLQARAKRNLESLHHMSQHQSHYRASAGVRRLLDGVASP